MRWHQTLGKCHCSNVLSEWEKQIVKSYSQSTYSHPTRGNFLTAAKIAMQRSPSWGAWRSWGTQEEKLHKIWLWKVVELNLCSFENQQGLTPGEMVGYRKLTPLYRANHTISVTQKPSTDTAVWLCKEIFWLILGHLPEEQRSVTNLSGDGNVGRCHFSCPPTSRLDTGRSQF